jgi:hypothetical protein
MEAGRGARVEIALMIAQYRIWRSRSISLFEIDRQVSAGTSFPGEYKMFQNQAQNHSDDKAVSQHGT